MSSWNPISYTIYAARDDEADKGFVWICNPALPSRAIVKLRCDNDGRRWTTFCEARHIDRNFLKQYAEGRKRVTISAPVEALVISEWYRNALGGFPTTAQRNSGHDLRPIPAIEISPMSNRVPIINLSRRVWGALRAANHHPDISVRLGTRLGVIGAALGIVGTVFAIWGLLPEHLRHSYHDWRWRTDLFAAVSIALTALTVVGLIGCRGPRRPTTLPESWVRSPSGQKSTPLAMILLVFARAETLHSAMHLLASMRAHEQRPRP